MAIVPEVVEARSMARRYDNLARLAELRARAGEVEVRSPVAATQPSSSYQTPGKAMIPNWDPATAIRMGYMANFVVSRCFNIIANDVAGCAFLAGLDRPRQPGQVVDHNPAARLAQLLGPPPGGPAPKLTGRRLVHWSIIQRKATGYCGWEIETTGSRGKGEIVALWPLVSANLRAVPSTSGSDWWQGFEYGPDGDVNKIKRLTPEQVFYGWDPSAEDFRQPESVLQSARLDVSIAVMSARYAYGFLRNDARPATVVVTDAFESDEAYHAFRSGWYGQFGGPENAGKAAFLEMPEDGALKPSEAIFVQTLGLSQKQAQFMEQHQASLERVAMACGVPWSRFSAAGRTYDNAGQEDEGYWVDTILPLVTDFADEINMQIAPRLGRETGWFDLSHIGVFQPKRRFASLQDAAYGLDHEVVVVDEVREDLGLGPAEWGGTEPIQPPAPIPLHVAPVAASAEQGEQRTAQVHSHWHTHADGVIHRHLHRHRDGVEPHGDWANVTHSHRHPETLSIEVGEQRGGIIAAGQTFRSRDQGPELVVNFSADARAALTELDDLRGGADDREAPEQAAEGSPPSEPVLATSPHDQRDAATERRTRTWRAHDATVRTLEKRTERVMRKLFARQEKAVLSRLEGNRGRRAIADGTPNPDEVFDPGFWSGETADDAEAFYEQIATAGFARLSAQFGISFDLEAPFARDFVQARANQLAGQVTDTTYQAIKDQLSEGVGKGESIPDLAARIRGVFDDASKNRSTVIARTEVGSALNGSVRLGASQLPSDVAAGMEWISTLDDRTRDGHDVADGQVADLDGTFEVNGEQLAYPGDPSGSPDNVVNCRCATGVLTPSDMPDAGDQNDQQAAGAQPGEQRAPEAAALAVLELVAEGTFDELAVRRALRSQEEVA